MPSSHSAPGAWERLSEAASTLHTPPSAVPRETLCRLDGKLSLRREISDDLGSLCTEIPLLLFFLQLVHILLKLYFVPGACLLVLDFGHHLCLLRATLKILCYSINLNSFSNLTIFVNVLIWKYLNLFYLNR